MAFLSDFIPDAAREDTQQLANALLRHEELRWAVRPVARAWSLQSTLIFIWSLMWLGFVSVWTYACLGFPKSLDTFLAFNSGRPLFALFSLPFWLMGFWMFCQPWLQKRRMRHSIYAITNRRALVLEKRLFSWNTRAFPLTASLVMERKGRPQGGGDLVFGQDIHHGRHGSERRIPMGFLHLPDLHEALRQLDTALDARIAAKNDRKQP